VSPQDALIAGLGLITSDSVGAGRTLLEGNLARFLIPLHDDDTAAKRMIELCDQPLSASLFTTARTKAEDYTATSCAMQWVARTL
jgi:hypothetical protein